MPGNRASPEAYVKTNLINGYKQTFKQKAFSGKPIIHSFIKSLKCTMLSSHGLPCKQACRTNTFQLKHFALRDVPGGKLFILADDILQSPCLDISNFQMGELFPILLVYLERKLPIYIGHACIYDCP